MKLCIRRQIVLLLVLMEESIDNYVFIQFYMHLLTTFPVEMVDIRAKWMVVCGNKLLQVHVETNQTKKNVETTSYK